MMKITRLDSCRCPYTLKLRDLKPKDLFQCADVMRAGSDALYMVLDFAPFTSHYGSPRKNRQQNEWRREGKYPIADIEHGRYVNFNRFDLDMPVVKLCGELRVAEE